MAPKIKTFTDPINNPFKTTAQIMEERLARAMSGAPITLATRKAAAQFLLDEREGWYTQTPEGEYLEKIAGAQ